MSVKLEVTQEAQSQVRELIKSQKPGVAVRVFLQAGGGGGGCSGGGCGSGGCACGSEGGAKSVSFGMAFDKPRNGDEVVQIDGFSVVVDSLTASELEGAKIDFVQGLDASGFQIISSKAPAPHEGAPSAGGGGCGCGSGGCC